MKGTIDMKHLLLTSVLALALTPAFSAENPVFKLFPGDVTFYLSFDEENSNADMAGGKGEPARKIGTVSYADGVFGGKSLRSGQLQFDAAKNLDLTLPGTVILWVAPENWPAEKTEPKEKEPGFGAFYAHGGSYELIIGKMGGQPWGNGHMNTYVQYPKLKKHVNCIVYGAGVAKNWKNREWRMLACTYKGGNFTNSVNGRKPVTSVLPALMAEPTRFFRLGTTAKDSDQYRVLVDEVVILKRALSDEEIRKLYDESIKVMPGKK